jgi:hypothetical protein
MILALVLAGVAATAQADERTVVIPVDATKPFTVEKTDIVRIPASTIAGGTIEVEVTGSAKIDTESVVRQKAGDSFVIGTLSKEYDLKPTGKGKVKVVVKTAGPGQAKNPTKTEYEFEVK